MNPSELVEGWAVVGNHPHHGPMREGARVYVSHYSGLDRVQVLVAPKGRRWAAYWTKPGRLYDLRVQRVVAPAGSKLVLAIHASTERCAALLRGLVEAGAAAAKEEEP